MGTIGENIYKIRMSMGLSQKEFGRLIGKSDSQVGSYENGLSDILASTIYKIAEVTHMDFNAIMSGQLPEKKEEEPKWDAELRIYNMKDRLTVIKILAKNGVRCRTEQATEGKRQCRRLLRTCERPYDKCRYIPNMMLDQEEKRGNKGSKIYYLR